jgi:RNA polymerase sigma factor (sigma-70 family)
MGPPAPATLDTFVSEHHASMLRLAIRLTGELESAEEVMQEALLRVTRNWAGFRGEAGFKTWATRILLNVFHDWLAKRRRPLPLEDVPDPRQPDPPSCAMAEELRRHIAQRVSALPPRQREVLILLTYEGHSAEEAAELLDMRLPSVYSTLYQARQRLRAELAPYLADSGRRGPVLVEQKPAACAEECHERQ